MNDRRAGTRTTLSAIAIQMGGTAFCALVSFALIAWLARRLGQDQFGWYVLVLNAATLVLMLIQGGWPTMVYRESVTGEPGGATRCSALRGGMANVLLVSAVLMTGGIGVGVIGRVEAGFAFAAAFACMTVVAVMNLVSDRMRGCGRFALEAAWQVSGRVVSALCIVLYLALAPGVAVPGIFLAWAVGLMLVVVLLGRGWVERAGWDEWAEQWRRALPIVALGAATAVLLKADVLLLGAFGGAVQTLSDYAAATRLVEMAVLLFAPFTNVLLRNFRLVAGDRSRLQVEACAWAGGGLFLGLAALPLAVLFGEAGMSLIFGADFGAAGRLLPWVMLALGPVFCNLVLIQAWLAMERDAALARRVFGAAAALLPVAWGGWLLAEAVGLAMAVALVQTLLMLSLAVGVLRTDR